MCKTILFVIGNPEKISNYRKIFSELQWSVEVHQTFDSAINRLDTKNHVSAIVCETKIKGCAIDGLSFARKYNKAYPVVLMSSSEEYVKESKQNGFVAFLRSNTSDDNIVNRVMRSREIFEDKKDFREVQNTVQGMREHIKNMDDKICLIVDKVQNLPCLSDPKKCAVVESNQDNWALLQLDKFLVSAKKSPILAAIGMGVLAVLSFLVKTYVTIGKS